MTTYRVTIHRITDLGPDERGYVREDAKEIYDQRVDDLDIADVVLVVNKAGIVVRKELGK